MDLLLEACALSTSFFHPKVEEFDAAVAEESATDDSSPHPKVEVLGSGFKVDSTAMLEEVLSVAMLTEK